MFSELARGIVSNNLNMLVPWYLMASYAYYINDAPIVSDTLFDEMSKSLLENWATIKHMHKDYISVDDLEAGTFLGEYPSRIKFAVENLINSRKKKKPVRNTLEDFFN
jgi:hypothetical protein